MNVRDVKKQITFLHYISILILVSMILIFSLTMVDINYYIQKYDTLDASEFVFDDLESEGEIVYETTGLTVITEGLSPVLLQVLDETAIYTGMIINTYTELDDIDHQNHDKEIVVISGQSISNDDDVDRLNSYIEAGYHIVMYSLPEMGVLSSESKAVLGINTSGDLMTSEQIRFFDDFFIGGLIELESMDYSHYLVTLLSTCKVFVDDGEDNPIIWRQVNNKGRLYVVNSPLFDSEISYGVLTSLLSDIHEDFIYPVVDAFSYTYRGMPFLSNENIAEIDSIYNRDSRQLQEDILIPDVIAVAKSKVLEPTLVVTQAFQTESPVVIDSVLSNQLENYEKDFNKLRGSFGYEITGDKANDQLMIESLSQYFDIDSFYDSAYLYTDNYLEETFIIDNIIRPWKVGERNLRVSETGVVNIPITYNELHKDSFQILELYAMMNAFGLVTHHLDMEHVIYPTAEKDNWIGFFKEYTEFLDSYREYFDSFTFSNSVETAKRIRVYLRAKPNIMYDGNIIRIKVDNWQGQMSFILRTDKDMIRVRNGTASKIDDKTYLVRANHPYILIELKPIGYR